MYINDLYLPARVYLHTDQDAPALTASNLSLVLKACLVTGYGSKPGAGWSMPFEDAATGKRVFRPATHGNLDNYLRVVDGNTQAVVQSYSDMSDIDNGNKALELSLPYMYAKRNFTGRWAIIATERSVVIWTRSYYNGGADTTGAMLFYGDSGQSHDGSKCCVLAHSGGTYNDGSFASLFYSDGMYPQDADQSARIAAAAIGAGQTANMPKFASLFGLADDAIEGEYLAPIYVRYNNRLYSIPGIHTNTRPRNNLDTFVDDGAEYITLHSYGWQNLKQHMSRLVVRTDHWRY